LKLKSAINYAVPHRYIASINVVL